ncbi:hypothetical protein ETN89_20365 (plasmid) [Photobacterium damselae subsp. damselae]|uniref:DUF5462 family protein n=1 Tax=Photobacterium damselae TaxID=38293 RepID=UPI000A2FB018|nr:DUF5462 family protein [Photobacterium damselae]ARR51832.1 hypothetical protein CAY62_20700 [Photobacterium damselae subsp. damselae]QAY37593.1 hypothetical protein ETN89_20365 [Photobacterium damselae subsp. damselae]
MRVTTLSVLCCALLSQSVLTKPVEMRSTSIDFGVVNGEIVNSESKIEKFLSDPILISVKQQDYDKPLKEFVIKDAVLTHQSSNELVLTVVSPLSNASTMKSQIAVGLWVDGQRSNLQGKQVGAEVSIATPAKYKEVELRVVKPIEMTLPQVYRGEFKYTIEIEAIKNEQKALQ